MAPRVAVPRPRSSISKPSSSIQCSTNSGDLATVPGIGPRRSAALYARQIFTLADALSHLPYRYEDLRRRDDVTTLRPGMTAVMQGILQNLTDRPMPGRWSRR